MALSTIKVADTIEWAKRLTFGRSSGIGNALEPALSSANMVMQTIIGPPFSWWWNYKDIVFTTNPTLATATITNIALTSNVVTITAANTFIVGQTVIPSAINVATFLNGQILKVATASATQITAAFTHADVSSAANTGTLTASTTQDYLVTVPEFSHIDTAAIQNPSTSPASWFELQIQDHLSLATETGKPAFISSTAEEQTAGAVTFRLMPAPDKVYPVVVSIMQAAPQITSLNQTWAPIPDFMQYIYNWGFLSLMYMFADDPRFAQANAKFTSGLIARAQGLSDTEKNIFLNNWTELTSSQIGKVQQGNQARTV